MRKKPDYVDFKKMKISPCVYQATIKNWSPLTPYKTIYFFMRSDGALLVSISKDLRTTSDNRLVFKFKSTKMGCLPKEYQCVPKKTEHGLTIKIKNADTNKEYDFLAEFDVAMLRKIREKHQQQQLEIRKHDRQKKDKDDKT